MTAVAHELEAPPWRRFDGTLIDTARGIRQAYDQAYADLGLTMPEASLLAFIAEGDPKTQTQLAQRLGTGRPVTGARIDALQARGAIHRQPHPHDRRVWLVQITDHGRDLVATINERDKALRTLLREGISRDERRLLADLLVRIQRNLGEMAQ
jgi:DNA-binding MarR family transcriptional regulator